MVKKEKGQAYLFVLILMMSVFIMLSLALYISGYEAKVSSAYHESSNLYLLAESGAEEGAALINRIGLQSHPSLAATAGNMIMNEMIKMDAAAYLEYRPDSLHQARQGNFHLKEKDENGLRGEGDILFQRIYGTLAASYIQTEFERILDKRGAGYWFSYEIGGYVVTVEITPVGDSFVILSTVLSENRKSKAAVEARVSCDFGGHDEIVVPAYEWNTPIPWSEYALYAQGNIEFYGDGIVTDEFRSGAEWASNSGVYFLKTVWAQDNHFVFIDRIQDVLDVKDFYSQTGDPEYTAVYAAGDLILETSDGHRSTFLGCVAARGNIVLRDVSVKGTVLAGGDIILEKNQLEEMKIQKDPVAVFKVRGEDKTLERTFYDLLGMTGFWKTDDFRVSGEKLADMLKYVTVGEDSSLEIRNSEGPLFKIVSLKEVR